MAMVLDFFVTRYLEKVTVFIEGELCKALGVKKDIERLQRRLMIIKGFVQDAENRRHKDATIDHWVKQLKDFMYDADDIIDRCMFEGGKLLESPRVCFSFGWLSSCFACVKHRHQIASRIKELNYTLKEIEEDRATIPVLQQIEPGPKDNRVSLRKTSSVEVKADIVGTQIEDASENLISLILNNDKQKFRVFGIVGMGGIGKTTLARKIFNDEKIKENFSIRIWLYVSKNYSDTALLKEMIRGAGGIVDGDKSREELENELVSLPMRNLFIVLDHVWSDEVWSRLLRNPIITGHASSTILVTTRDESVTISMEASHTHKVQKMSTDDGWDLLREKLLKDEKEVKIRELQEIGYKIVEKCGGLPLAVSVIGGALRFKDKSRIEWEKVFESDLWDMKQIDQELPRALYLSYEDLPCHLKQCFLYCALYSIKGGNYKELARIWVAEGFVVEQGKTLLEELGEEYYKELIWRNLVQPDPTVEDQSRYLVHDLLRALAANLIGQESMSIEDGQQLSSNPLTKIRRLSVLNMRERLTLEGVIMKQKCLRTLLLVDSPRTKTIEDDVFKALEYLRVLDLSKTCIETLPDSFRKLLHLRYLDLDGTDIREIPESIGQLANLQTLNVSGCECLHRLPNTLTRLCNLRCLRADGTPLSHVPKGLGRLRNLNCLHGFVVGHDASSDEGCDLEELQSLDQLRSLHIKSLERAKRGASVLANKSFLRELDLSWMPSGDGQDGAPWSEEKIQGAGTIWDELSPPSSLQGLTIEHFPGRRFPCWMMSTSLDASFPHLAYLVLKNVPSCMELPPLGMLPQLKSLNVEGAKAIKIIGSEVLGHGIPGAPAFPELESITFTDMPNWEAWSTCMEQYHGVTNGTDVKVLPNLKKILLKDCPKLGALPEVLDHAIKLKSLALQNTPSLREIKKLPSIDDLKVTDNPQLERISDLPSLRTLMVKNCPRLMHVDNLDMLEFIILLESPSAQYLPQGLVVLLQKLRNAPQRCLKAFAMVCGSGLLSKCQKDEMYWHLIQGIPIVVINTIDGHGYIRYVKDPFIYDTNVAPAPK